MGCRCVLLDSSFPFPEVATWRWRNVSRFSKGTVRGCRSVWSCLEKEATRSRGWFILNVGYRWYTPWIESNSCEITRTPLLVGRWSLWFVHLFPSIYFSRLIDQNYPIVVSKVFWIELFLTRTWSRRIIKISWILVHGCRYIYIYFCRICSILFKKLDEINFYRSTIESNGSKEETTRSKARDNKTLIGQTVVEGYTQQWAIKIGINSGKRNAQGRERGWLCEVITSDLETRSPYE